MCGIFGILSVDSGLDKELLGIPNSIEILKHRGPDGKGYYIDDSIYLGHRRLSIIDIEGGNQPLFNEDKKKCVIFNGEIYNFIELRGELERKGHRFRTNSDTEVIVHAYEEWGTDCVQKFRGMFAFALWDSIKKELFLARDRLGIKPLFYYNSGRYLIFASEIKAILQVPGVQRSLSLDGLAGFLLLSYIPAPYTIFEGIRKLEAGHYLFVRNEAIKKIQYWDVCFEPDYSKSEKYFAERVSELLFQSVRLRMISDVPIGAFLSGGIDSGIVVALMSKLSREHIKTFCMGFGGTVGGYLDERRYAKSVASKYHCDHEEFEVLPKVEHILDRIVEAFDEPFADHSTIPSYHLCKITRQKVKVALSGLGGDELFGGYERHLGFKLSKLFSLIPTAIQTNIIRPFVEKLPERRNGHYTVNHIKRFFHYSSLKPAQRYIGFSSMRNAIELLANPKMLKESFLALDDFLVRIFNKPTTDDILNKALYFDIKMYLPEDILTCTDRMSMAHSLEVRVPFIDHKLVELCATIPSELKIKWYQKKYLLRKMAREYLPEQVINHRKQGFVGPLAKWLQTDLKPVVLKILNSEEVDRIGIFKPKEVQKVLNDHFQNKNNNDKLIWSLLIFHKWHKKYME